MSSSTRPSPKPARSPQTTMARRHTTQQRGRTPHKSSTGMTLTTTANAPTVTVQMRFAPPESERLERKKYSPDCLLLSVASDQQQPHQQQRQMTMLPVNAANPSANSPPHRSQSFRHRPRPQALDAAATNRSRGGANLCSADGTADAQERRRSTPTIQRRCSLQRARVEPRIDAWPEPKQMSEVEERFLRLPDSGDYTRVRQFNIDAKGAVISRGDSFRRKRVAAAAAAAHTNNNNNINNNNSIGGAQPQSVPVVNNGTTLEQSGTPSPQQREDAMHLASGGTRPGSVVSRSTSASSAQHQGGGSSANGSTRKESSSGDESAASSATGGVAFTAAKNSTNACTSSCSYKICVLGQTGAGKSALIRQFVTSEYRNAFADEITDECPELCAQQNPGVSINIGGHECDLSFTERDPQAADAPPYSSGDFHAYLLVYSIDRKTSFRVAVRALEELRAEHCPAPIILVGNKADLERKRTVLEHEVKTVMHTFDVPHFEVSVALNHDVDDLLVGIVAQIKDAFRMHVADQQGNAVRPSSRSSDKASEDFHAAIRRFSQRKKRQMGLADELDAQNGKCTNLFAKLRRWRKGASNC